MTHTKGGGPYAFVSYASAERERALRIADLLEGQGVPVWIDRVAAALREGSESARKER